MPNTPNLALPYPTPTAPADIPADIQALATSVDTKLGAAGTSLPTSPTDGQEFFYVADDANGVIWHLRYRAASTSSHKWEWVGGTNLLTPLSGDLSTSSTTPVALTGGPSITIPIAGNWRFEWSGRVQIYDAGQTNMYTGIALNGAILDNNAAAMFVSGANGTYMGGDVTMRHTALDLAAGGVITLVCWAYATHNCRFGPSWLAAHPVRVG
jgi:hypothetical protein